jgi:hypothetical protein
MVVDACLVPLAYFKQLFALIKTITDNDETMDEFHEKVNRVFTIIKFFFAGLPILIFSVFIDTYNFFINLFYEPEMQVFSEHRGKVSKKGIVTFTETV